ncbi:MAG: universal stress protein [Chloroflexota bacterium]
MKNYQTILVPLDGSDLAETALADALLMADVNHAKVILLQAVEPAEHVIGLDSEHPIYLDQQWESQKGFAQDYLNNISRRLKKEGVESEIVVELGAGAETILDYAQTNPVDLIVMATHGRSGVSRWVYGSVADKVLRGAETPILLIRANNHSN